jgi:hypothetical protein
VTVGEEVSYYAIVGVGRTPRTPSGLARRRYTVAGPVDEALRRDLTWEPDAAIIEWEYGEVGADLLEISPAAADRLIAAFRVRWGEPA